VYQNENYKRIQRIDKAYKLDFNLILDDEIVKYLNKKYKMLKMEDKNYNNFAKLNILYMRSK
jgi:hypothetical protein